MAKAKVQKLNFSKFLPESAAFITVSGRAESPKDFSIDVKIGDGDKSISLFTTDWYKEEPMKALKAIQEGITKAIEFQQKALKMPDLGKVEFPTPKRVLKSTETVVKKKAAKK